MLSAQARTTADAEWQASISRQTDETFKWVGRNGIADFVVRVALYGAAGLILVRLIYYVFSHADPMASELLEATTQDDLEHWWQTLGSVTWPIILLLIIAALCVALGLYVHNRGSRDFERGQEGVSRLRRDATGVPRARALTQVLEESVTNARRAFNLQLWLSRSLFIFGVALLLAFVGNALVKQDLTLLSGIFGIGAVGTLISAGVAKPGHRVGAHLADITQLQLVTIAAMRQIGILEEHIYQVLQAARDDPATADAMVTSAVDKMTMIAECALAKIQQYAEPVGGDT